MKKKNLFLFVTILMLVMATGCAGYTGYKASPTDPRGPGVPVISNFHFDPPVISMTQSTQLVFDFEDDDGDMDRIRVVITYPGRSYHNPRGEWKMKWTGKTSGTAKYTLRPGYFTTSEVHTFTIQLIDRKGNISNSLQADVSVGP